MSSGFGTAKRSNLGGFVRSPLGVRGQLGIGELFAVGSFTLAFPFTHADYIATWDGRYWGPVSGGLNGTGLCLCEYDGKLIVGGSFTQAGGSSANRIATWDGTSWGTLGSGLNGTCQALAVHSGNLIAGGSFTQAGGGAANYIAQWNGSAWSAMGTGFNAQCLGLGYFGADLIAVGDFTAAGAVFVLHVAKWTGAAWDATYASGVIDARPWAAMTYGGDPYLAGYRVQWEGIGGYHHIAFWDGAAWADLPNDPVTHGPSSGASVMVEYDGELIVGNNDGTWAWDGVGGWTDLLVSSDALAVQDGTLYAGSPVAVGRYGVQSWDGAAWTLIGNGFNAGVRDIRFYTAPKI